MENDQAPAIDEGLESTDPTDLDADLGDAIKDGSSNTLTDDGD